MNFYILTLFPEMVMHGLNTSITGRAIQQNKIGVEAVNIRDFSTDKHGRVDDYTYGGGAGMLMKCQPVYDAYQSVCQSIAVRRDGCDKEKGAVEPGDKPKRIRTIYVTPQGLPFTQQMAADFAKSEDLVLLCGHYEGIDERVLEEVVTDYVSIGDYVLTGGELAAMVIVDAIARLVPDVLHNEVSAETESFHGNLLEYPQYSRPEEWHGKRVPEVLLSGNTKKISEWRLAQSIERTAQRRPDLHARYMMLDHCRKQLMKDKLNHIDMIELINRGRAELIAWDGDEMVLKDIQSDAYFHTDLRLCTRMERLPEEITKYKKESQLTQILRVYQPKIIALHQKEWADKLEHDSDYRLWAEYVQAVCTQREKLRVSGLYRDGLEIRMLAMEQLEFVADHYKEEPREYLEERIRSGAMYGAFYGEEMVGFGGIHAEGVMGLLYVQPAYRRRRIAEAIETFLCNYFIEQGLIPYCQVSRENEASLGLQRKLGLHLSKGQIYWMEGK